MNRKILFSLVIFSLIFTFNFCNKNYDNIKSSLSLVSYNADSLVVVDFEKGRKKGFFEIINIPKFYSENFNPIKELSGNYEQFVKETGVDFQRSVRYLIIAGGINEKGVIIGVNHQAQKLRKFFGKIGIGFERMEIDGIDFYTSQRNFDFGEYSQLKKLSYLSYKGKIFVVGDYDFVKTVVKNIKRKNRCLLDNEKIMSQLKRIDEDSVVWGIINLGKRFDSIVSKNINISGPLSIKDLSLILFYANYDNEIFKGQVKTISKDVSKNEKIVDFLNGIKAILSIGESKFAKLFEHLKFTYQDEEIILNFSIPREVLKKVLKKRSDGK